MPYVEADMVERQDTMSATAAAATSAASGQNGKAKKPMIHTGLSASFPSELYTPQSASSEMFRYQEPTRTPISPPTSYTDFLHKATPGLMSPPSTAGPLTRNNSDDSTASSDDSKEDSLNGNLSSTNPAKTKDQKRPTPVVRHPSTDSLASSWTCSSSSTDSSTPVTSGPSNMRPDTPRIIIPAQPFRHPNSAHTPRYLHNLQSPFSPMTARSPMSARTTPSPYITSAGPRTPWSAGPARVPFGPRPVNRSTTTKVADNHDPAWLKQVKRTTTTTTTKTETSTVVELMSENRVPRLETAPRGKRRKTVSEGPDTTPTQERQDAKFRQKQEATIKEEEGGAMEMGQKGAESQSLPSG